MDFSRQGSKRIDCVSFNRLMEKFKIFTAFYHLSELRSREDLIKGIMENLDYSMYDTLPVRNSPLLTIA